MTYPRIFNLKRGGRLIISRFRTGEMSLTVDYGGGLTGCITEPDEAREIARVLEGNDATSS